MDLIPINNNIFRLCPLLQSPTALRRKRGTKDKRRRKGKVHLDMFAPKGDEDADRRHVEVHDPHGQLFLPEMDEEMNLEMNAPTVQHIPEPPHPNMTRQVPWRAELYEELLQKHERFALEITAAYDAFEYGTLDDIEFGRSLMSSGVGIKKAVRSSGAFQASLR